MIPSVKTRAPRAVADVLPSALPQIADRLTHFRIRQSWATLVGPDVARRARPDALAAGTLRVVVDNSPWLLELTLREAEVLAKVRDRFPDVRALRFTVGALDDEPAAARAAKRRAVPLTTNDYADIDAATAPIADPIVADAARRLLVTARRFPRDRPRSPRSQPRGAE
jgi:hypothetical protein